MKLNRLFKKMSINKDNTEVQQQKKVTCKNCGLEISEPESVRCPRCFKLIVHSCSDCGKCSL